MSVRILEGDALTVLGTLPDQSVQCCVTSPPYFGLRDYGVSGQLGLEKTPQLYVDAMVAVFSEVKRVLRDDGTLWLNIGDSYAGVGAQTGGTNSKEHGRRADRMFSNSYRALPDGVKAKDLYGVPWMLALALRADGWYLRSDIIWHKPNPMPESVTDRPTKSHEYLFLLTKSASYYYDADAIAEPSVSTEDPRFGGPRISYDRKTGPTATPDYRGQRSAVTIRESRNRRSVWTVNTSPYSEAHFATFPPKLIEPCILAGSAKQACETCGAPWVRISERLGQPAPTFAPLAITESGALPDGGVGTHRNMGGRYQAWLDANPKQTSGFKPTCDCENSGTAQSIVLDPFGGAGTTGLVADRLGRDAILIELNPKYAEMARKRITDDSPLFGDVA